MNGGSWCIWTPRPWASSCDWSGRPSRCGCCTQWRAYFRGLPLPRAPRPGRWQRAWWLRTQTSLGCRPASLTHGWLCEIGQMASQLPSWCLIFPPCKMEVLVASTELVVNEPLRSGMHPDTQCLLKVLPIPSPRIWEPHSIVFRILDSGFISQLCCFGAVLTWAADLPSLGLRLPLCEPGIMTASISEGSFEVSVKSCVNSLAWGLE